MMIRKFLFSILPLIVTCKVTNDPPSPPSVEFDCLARKFAFKFATVKIPWLSEAERRCIQDALRLQECPLSMKKEIFSKKGSRQLEDSLKPMVGLSNGGVVIFVDPVRGDDDNASGEIDDPFRTLGTALALARVSSSMNTTIILRGGRYYLEETLLLDARDNGLTIQAYPNEKPILSGGDSLSLTLRATKDDPRIYTAKLPAYRTYIFTMLFLSNNATADDTRLVWARQPNGHPERDLQPDGFARANGAGSATSRPNASGSIHVVVKEVSRNSTVYPWFGEDLDPRGGGNWLHFGGTGDRFVDQKGFWNGTIPMGLRYHEQDFNTSHWTPEGYAPAVAHVFHNGFWGNWQFRVGDINSEERQLFFTEGGWQEGRGGGIRDQPFFVEGVREALDSPGEWWLDIPKQTLYYFPYGNETGTNTVKSELQIDFVAPSLKRLVAVIGNYNLPAVDITIRGLTFVHTASTFLDPYEVPSPGDWSIRRDGALFVENTRDLRVVDCRFLRTGGNGIFLSGHVKKTRIARNQFSWIGDSAIATVGRLSMADGFTVDTFPEDTHIESNHFREIGIHGKQTSALFSALSCRTTFASNVAYNGPRAGINLNDQFCHGHKIRDNLLFNWVRETQDHGPINTWDRALYIQKDPATNQPTLIPLWTHVARNFIMNGPSGNRDLGNLFPTIDNDDGSSYFHIANNFLVYGGAKNYLGHDKIWTSNLIVHPGRWSGDPCGMLWGGKNHLFEKNTCIVAPGNAPIGLDGSMKGFACKIDWNDPDNLEFVGQTANNVYYIDGDWAFECGNGTSSTRSFTLKEMQNHGWETGSVALDSKELEADAIIVLAKKLLSNGTKESAM